MVEGIEEQGRCHHWRQIRLVIGAAPALAALTWSNAQCKADGLFLAVEYRIRG